MTDRRLVPAATMTVLVLLLVLGAVLGWRAVTAPFSDTADADSDSAEAQQCEDGLAKGDLVHTDDVTVSVFNAGSRSGLAGQTQQQLVSRGFIPGSAGNAPGNLSGVKYVRVLAPAKNDPAARLVARQFGPNTFIQVGRRDLGPGVDVVVGDDFVGLVDAPRRMRARAAGSGC